MGYNLKLREEELKLKVAKDFFKRFDSTKILGNIDFCISYENRNIFETTSFYGLNLNLVIKEIYIIVLSNLF